MNKRGFIVILIAFILLSSFCACAAPEPEYGSVQSNYDAINFTGSDKPKKHSFKRSANYNCLEILITY